MDPIADYEIIPILWDSCSHVSPVLDNIIQTSFPRDGSDWSNGLTTIGRVYQVTALDSRSLCKCLTRDVGVQLLAKLRGIHELCLQNLSLIDQDIHQMTFLRDLLGGLAQIHHMTMHKSYMSYASFTSHLISFLRSHLLGHHLLSDVGRPEYPTRYWGLTADKTSNTIKVPTISPRSLTARGEGVDSFLVDMLSLGLQSFALTSLTLPRTTPTFNHQY
jgi:hypothetical protein